MKQNHPLEWYTQMLTGVVRFGLSSSASPPHLPILTGSSGSWAGAAYAVSDTGSALEIPLADISYLAVKKTNTTKSVLLGLGIAAGVFVALVAALAIYCNSTAGTVNSCNS
jgi:hypothetical protein